MKKCLTVLLVIAVMFTFSFGSAFAATGTVEPDKANQVTFAKVQEELNKAAADLKAQELAVKTEALTDIFKTASSTTLNGVTVTKDAVEKVYNDEVYDKKIADIDKELSEELQAAQVSMNLSAVPAADESAVSSAFSGDGYVKGTSKVAFSGYFTTDADSAYTYDKVLDTVYVYPAYDKTFDTTASTDTAYTAVFAAGATAATDEPTGSAVKEVGKTVFEAARDAAVAAINAIDLSAYSKEYNGQAESNYDKALKAVNDALKAISDAETAAKTTDTWEGYAKTGKKAIDDVYTAPVNQKPASGSFMDALNAIPKISDEATEEAKLAFAKSKVLSEVTSKINAYYDTLIAKTDNNILTEQLKGSAANAEKIAKYQEERQSYVDAKAAATEVLTYLVNDKEDYKDLIKDYDTTSSFDAAAANVKDWDFSNGTLTVINDAGTKDNSTYTEATIKAIVKHVADLKEEAELLKVSIGIDGTTAVQIDKALEKAIDETYKGNTSATLGKFTEVTFLVTRINELTGSGDVTVNNRSYKGVSGWLTSGFEADQNDEVRAVIAEAKASIRAAASIEEADAAFLAAYEKYDAIPTTADKNKVQATKEFKDLLTQYNGEIAAYVNYKAESIKAAGKTDDYSWDKDAMTSKLKETFAKAYTVDELKAAFTAAKAEVDNLKTSAALKAEKEAIDARIAALPATITAADKETVKALNADIEAHNDYCDLIGNTAQKVVVTAAATNAAAKIQSMEDKAITDAYNAIMKDGKVTVDEKAAVEALRAAYDAYVKDYTKEDAASLTLPTIGDTKMTDVEGKLAAAEVKAVEEMIAKLPADGSDVAAVRAAREAYDALTIFQKAAVGAVYYDKLIDCEKLAYSEDFIKAYLQDLSIVARSVKTAKGSIKVTINADVQPILDAGYTVEYKFYRSTKPRSSYGKARMVKTENVYTNTTGTKGVRYYYKAMIQVKDAEGNIVATTPLSQCKYACRVK